MKINKKITIITALLILLVSSSMFTSANVSSKQTESLDIAKAKQNHYYTFNKDVFVVFYDGLDPLSNQTGVALVNSLKLMTPDVMGLSVNSLDDIKKVLNSYPYLIAVYVFPTTYDRVTIHTRLDDNHYSFREFAKVTEVAPDTHHIFAMGNTRQILNEINPRIDAYGSNEERVDANLMYIYALWTIADILEKYDGKRKELGNDIRMASLKYFSNNFNQFVEANIEPTNPMGEESPETIQARKDNFFAKHPVNITRMPRDGYVVDQDLMRDVNPLTGEVRREGYVMDMFPIESAGINEFILQLLPEDSGLRGPVGGIVDALLKVLFNYIGGAIGLSDDTVENLVNLMFSIPDFIGAIANPNSSKIKSFIDQLKPLLPISQEYYKYIDLLVDGLFLLRGDANDITSFLSSAISLLVPDMTIGGFKLPDLLGEVFSLGADVFNKIKEGKNAIDIILSVLNENIVKNLLKTVFGNGTIYGIGVDDIPTLINKLMGFVSMGMNLITNFDPKQLIEEYGPQLLTTLLPSLGISESYSKMIMSGIGMIFTATKSLDNANLQDILAQLIQYASAGGAVLGTDTISVDDIDYIAVAKQVVQIISDAVNNGISDINSFKDSINSVLSAIGVDSNIISAIEDASAIIVALQNADVSLDSLTTITGLVGKFLTGINVVDEKKVKLVKEILGAITGLVAFIKNPPKLKDVIGGVMEQVKENKEGLSKLLASALELLIAYIHPTSSIAALTDFADPSLAGSSIALQAFNATNLIETVSKGISYITQIVGNVKKNNIEGIMLTLLQGGAYVISKLTGQDVSGYIEVAKALFGQILGLAQNPPSVVDLVQTVLPLLNSSLGISSNDLETVLGFLISIQDVFTNGFSAIFSKLAEWLTGQIMDLIKSLTGGIGDILGQETWDLFSIDMPIGIGDFSLFTVSLSLGLSPGFKFDTEKFTQMIFDLVFRGVSFFDPTSTTDNGGSLSFGDILRKTFSFFTIIPIFSAKFELKDFGSGSSSFITFMLEALGVELKISGYGFFKLQLLSFVNGIWSWDDFMKVIEWGFGFAITLSRTFTLLDFLTGGAGGSLNSIGKYIGLDAISITIAFTIALDIVMRAATENQPETGSLTISLTIGFTVSLGIDIIIATLKLVGTLEITLTLLQDLVAPTPLEVYIAIQLTITVTIGFLFWDWDFDYKWSPKGFAPPLGKKISPSNQQDAQKQGALGADYDNDGLSNEYENKTAGLDPWNADSDGDGLSDKFEIQTLKTDAANPDTDGDGLADNIEINLGTNPLQPDSDFDGLNDYEETAIYGTNPLTQDTDADGLTDKYEITHVWDISGVTTTVHDIMIGGVAYQDRTDPLNPDTDGDGLLDGEEGPRGIYYGPELYNTSDHDGYTPDPPLFFNGGYTHPLDADTDDDSYWQLYDGSIAPMPGDKNFLMDMSDYTEIHGISVVFIDPDTGEPLPAVIVRTNPTNPDSDGDTGVTAAQREDPPFGLFLNSDGYELSRDPPTDPLDGDSDDDGLIDGLEGMLRYDSNHTYALNPDTDGDGLGDLQEVQLGTDGRSIDTDLDGVSDGDEFFKYGTNPFLNDTDSDGLLDGEELFLYHTNPHSPDSDGDGLKDYDEVWVYLSDPMDRDSDNDFLTDWEEVVIYHTDPFNADTDGDKLLDGEEVQGLPYMKDGQQYFIYTDPTRWDTDNDSITWLDQNGEMSQPMSDYDEYILGTDPTIRDTDMDGIQDGWEQFLGSGKIPWMDPIKIDPLNNDTDGDGLMDGTELVVANVTTLLNPYIAFTLLRPYNTSVVSNDTDNDQISDYVELYELRTRPDNLDTDNDTLTDYAEWQIYHTSPVKADTDGDGLVDQHEIFGRDYSIWDNDTKYYYNRTSLVVGTFVLDPLKSDSDGDLLPDGAEIFDYSKDPTNPDENGNGILDGMEIDSDGDGLYDGEEYYVYGTAESAYGGGPHNPDSDRDGLFDGMEVYETNSDPAKWDTDGDGFSDGLEWYCHTSLTENNTLDEIQACFKGLVRIAVLSPVSKTYETNSIPVIVYDSTGDMTSMSYRYRPVENETLWSSSYPMIKTTIPGTNSSTGAYWNGTYLGLPYKNGTYVLQVEASNSTNTYTREVTFSINALGSDIVVVSPEAKTYSFNELQTPSLPIKVKSAPDINATKFRIKFANGTLLQDNTTLNYESGLNAYYLPDYEFPKINGRTDYIIEVFGMKTSGVEIVSSVIFTIKTPTAIENVAIVATPVVGIGGGAAIIRKATKFKNPFSKRKASRSNGLRNPFRRKS